METLNYDVILVIFKFSNIIDIMKFMSTCKLYKSYDVDSFWRIRIIQEYPNYNQLYLRIVYLKDNDTFWKRKKLIGIEYTLDKQDYIDLYNNICIVCDRETDRYDHYFRKRICYYCNESEICFATINQSKALRDYILNKKDILNCKSVKKSKGIIYLKRDILKICDKKYGDTFEIKKTEQIDKRITKTLKCLLKFTFLNDFLITKYNVHLHSFSNNSLKIYTSGMYQKYIKGSKQIDMITLVHLILQLDYIRNIIKFKGIIKPDQFDELLLQHIEKISGYTNNDSGSDIDSGNNNCERVPIPKDLKLLLARIAYENMRRIMLSRSSILN